MTVEAIKQDEDVPTIALDGISHLIDTYRSLDEERRKLGEMQDAVRREIQAALGDNQVGTVRGFKAVRWTRVTQHRLSIPAIRRKFTARELEDCYVDTPQSRFTIIDGKK